MLNFNNGKKQLPPGVSPNDEDPQMEKDARAIAAKQMLNAPQPFGMKTAVQAGPATQPGQVRTAQYQGPAAATATAANQQAQAGMVQGIDQSNQLRQGSPTLPLAPKQADPTKGYYMDPQVEAMLRKMIGNGPRNTADEQALAQKTVERNEGQALADSRARAGFAGFGLSGAANAQDSDIRSKAADQILQQKFGIQQSARDDFRKDASLATGAFDSEAGRQLTHQVEGDKNKLTQQELDINKDAWQKALEIMQQQKTEDDKAAGKQEASANQTELDTAAGKGKNATGTMIYNDGKGLTASPGDNTYAMSKAAAKKFIDNGTMKKVGDALGATVYVDTAGTYYTVAN